MAKDTYSKAEVDALVAAATGKASGQSDLDAIASRPYHTIVAKDGMALCVPPTPGGGGGPLTLNGEHPDDFYGVEEQDDGKGGKQYVATKNV